MTTAQAPAGRRVLRALTTGTPVYVLLAVLLAALALTDPGFYEPDRFLAFIKRAAPLVILAAGQYLVIVCGEFDLSVGAIVTAGVVVAAELYGSFPGAPWLLVTAVLLLAGALAGLVSGLITTLLRVPSFITTLGMMLILEGAVFFWTGGSPHGALPTAFRRLGRGTAFGWLPWAVLVCVVAGLLAVRLMRSDFGRTLLATGDSERVAALAGVRVARARTIA
ncbi:ABC transporter permease [Streptomyces sp. NPDC014724]|uniref:ABC transporter permease n=1 Tax=unclassified Streptomyces TaxID=2593676 RepID=UPI0036FC70ED